MANHIRLTRLNELRRPQDPLPMTTLRYQARKKLLPGAFFMGQWMVDLDVYDAAIREQTDPAAPSPASSNDELDQVADNIMQRLEFKEAS